MTFRIQPYKSNPPRTLRCTGRCPVRDYMDRDMQCCGSGSGIRDPVPFDPGSGIRDRKIQDEHPRSYFRELRNNFFGLKICKFFDEEPDSGSGIFFTLDPGSGMEKFGSGIRDKHPGSAIRDKHPGSAIRDKHPGSATLGT
jgi:hypothetical protein